MTARILWTLLMLLKETRPAVFFGVLGGLTAALGLLLAVLVLWTWAETGLVPRLPTAVLATGLMVVACLFATCGLILDSLSRGRLEQKRILYLGVPALRAQ